MLACVDGERLPLEEATVPLADRSVQQADAVFEVMRTYGGRPHAFEAHLERLKGSCARVGLPADDVERLGCEALALLDDVASGSAEWSVRLWIGARGAPGLARLDGQTRRAVLLTPLKLHPRELYETGAEVVTRASAAPPPSTHGAKTTNYLSSIVATTAARSQGAHEIIRLGPYGEVLEGGSSSVFVWDGRGLYTPPLSSGILPGITRQLVMRLGCALGLEVRERLLTVHDLYRASELLLTSSIREVMPVVRVDGLSLADGAPGPVGRRLAEAYTRDAMSQTVPERP